MPNLIGYFVGYYNCYKSNHSLDRREESSKKSQSLDSRESEADINNGNLTRVSGHSTGQHARRKSDQALRKRACAKTRAKARSAKPTKVNCARKFVFLRVVRTVLFGNGNLQQATCKDFVQSSNRDLCGILSSWYSGWLPHQGYFRQLYISSMLGWRTGREHLK